MTSDRSISLSPACCQFRSAAAISLSEVQDVPATGIWTSSTRNAGTPQTRNNGSPKRRVQPIRRLPPDECNLA
jgi:hypothetical protein